MTTKHERPDWAPPNSRWVLAEGIAATTHEVPSHGVRLARAALEGMVADFTPMPMHREHGAARIGTVLRAWLHDREDGETEVRVEFECWAPPDVDPAQWLPNALSPSMMEKEWETPQTSIVIGADSTTFDADALAEVRKLIGPDHPEISVERYHQFAALPPPLIIVILTEAALPLLYGVVATGTYDLLKATVVKLLGQSRQADRPARLKIKIGDTAEVDLTLPVHPDDAVAAIDSVFDGVVEIVKATRSEETGGEPGGDGEVGLTTAWGQSLDSALPSDCAAAAQKGLNEVIGVDRRVTLTRLALGGVVGGLLFKKREAVRRRDVK